MNITVEKVGSRIYLRSPWDPDLPDVLKSLGGSWAPKAKAWTYPLDIEMCRKLRFQFEDDLTIGPELWAWAANEVERQKQLSAVGNVRDMDIMATMNLPRIRELAPTMWTAMTNRPYQPVASLYVAEARQSLLADQPGVGKTIEVLGGLIEAGKSGQVLVIAPLKSTQVVWEPEIHRWMDGYELGYSATRISNRSPAQLKKLLAQHEMAVKENPDGLHFLIVNAEMCRIDHKGVVCPTKECDGYQEWCPAYEDHRGGKPPKHEFLFFERGPRGGKHPKRWDAVIADETHQWLINTRGKSASQVGYGMTRLRTAEDNFRVAMTGTPLKGKKHNLFGTLNWLRPEVYKSKWRWIGEYFLVQDGEYGGKQIGDLAETRKDAFFRSLDAIMIRRTKRELRAANPAWMPPDKVYHDVYVEMNSKQQKMYDAMLKDSEVELASGRLEANGILAEMTRLMQFASCAGDIVEGKFTPQLPSCKFDWLLEFLEERGISTKTSPTQKWGDLSDDVQKVVVASPFTTMLELWDDELRRKGIRTTMITGKTKQALKEMQLFQGNNDFRVCLINTKAGGVSITLDAADDIVILGETWVPDEQEQVEDRVHRASNVTHQVDVWYVRTKGSVEEGVAAVNMKKGESNHVVLDANRGLAFARSIQKNKKMGKKKS